MRHVFQMMLLMCLVVVGGCAALGAIVGKVAGNPPVEPRYTPPPTSLLVLAENYRRMSASTDDADRIARTVASNLRSKEVAPVIDHDQLIALRDELGTDFRKLNVQQIATRLGAEQVLYIDVLGCAVGSAEASEMLKGEATARVRMIDVKTGSIVYPLDVNEGLPVGFETPIRRPSDKVSRDSIRTESISGLSLRIARLFYKWTPESGEIDMEE